MNDSPQNIIHQIADGFASIEAKDRKVDLIEMHPIALWSIFIVEKSIIDAGLHTQEEGVLSLWGSEIKMNPDLGSNQIIFQALKTEDLPQIKKDIQINPSFLHTPVIPDLLKKVLVLSEYKDAFDHLNYEKQIRTNHPLSPYLTPGNIFEQIGDLNLIFNTILSGEISSGHDPFEMPSFFGEHPGITNALKVIRDHQKTPLIFCCSAKNYNEFRKLGRDQLWIETHRDVLKKGIMASFDGVVVIIHKDIAENEAWVLCNGHGLGHVEGFPPFDMDPHAIYKISLQKENPPS